jgi:hypothetical protein
LPPEKISAEPNHHADLPLGESVDTASQLEDGNAPANRSQEAIASDALDANASHDGDATASRYQELSDSGDAQAENEEADGFARPKRYAQSPSPTTERSPIDTSRRFFPDEFNPEADHQDAQDNMPRSWADIEQEDDLGEIPAGQTEAQPRRQSSLSITINLSFDDVLKDMMRCLSPSAREILAGRAKDLRNARVNTKAHNNIPKRNKKDQSSKGASSKETMEGQHRPPQVHKGKGRDLREGPSALSKGQEAAEIDQQTTEDA